MKNTIINGDCLEVMKNIEDKSVDMILCDLPYGTTGISWDVIIPFDLLWEQYERIIKDNGAIVLTASQPFTTKLIASNYKMFRYEWIWTKNNSTGFANAKKMPMKKHENICVFYKKIPTYNAQGLVELEKPKTNKRKPRNTSSFVTSEYIDFRNKKYKNIEEEFVISENNTSLYNKTFTQTHTNYPNSVLNFSQPSNKTRIHPTEKPLDLWEYLIKTYTNEGDLVLDNCSGSGVTAEACINTNRDFICIELDKNYYEKSIKRIETIYKNKTIKNYERRTI